jgi:alpha-1,3-mannosyltransferase
MVNVRNLRSLFKAIALLATTFFVVLGFGYVRYSDRVFPISTGSLNPPSESQYFFIRV